MTRRAAGHAGYNKNPCVRTLLEKLRLFFMATAAGISQPRRVRSGLRVIDRPRVMDSVAVNALRRLQVALAQFGSVHAAAVKSELVGAPARFELAHEGGVAVACAAKFRNVFPHDARLHAASIAHGGVGAGLLRVAAVTGGTTDSVLIVNIILENGARAFLHQVAVETGILGGKSGCGSQQRPRQYVVR